RQRKTGAGANSKKRASGSVSREKWPLPRDAGDALSGIIERNIMTATTENQITLAQSHEWFPSGGGKATTHSIIHDGRVLGNITYFSGKRDRQRWLVTLKGKYGYGGDVSVYGDTPAMAMRTALTSGIEDLSKTLGFMRAVAVEHGAGLVAAMEEML
ncbi:MAG: hypothetical protein LUC93_00715, partial [Planctomycetaceae bacterium]|nr:hypothetical protein [Planctomycetaceae bacterium]